MNIKEFFELSAGKWFVQRTIYQLSEEKPQSSKSEITNDILTSDDPAVIQLCQQNRVDCASVWGGLKSSWDTGASWGKTKQTGSSILIPISNSESSDQGKLLLSISGQSNLPSNINYVMGEDEALTLICSSDSVYMEERVWFASPNLRLRTSLAKNGSDYTQTTFYSEIRRIPPKEKQE